ncbi:MAG: hypothetical protein VW999_09740 [Alphaproteobacteria bacterium]
MEWTDEELAAPLNDEAKEASQQGNLELAVFVIAGVVIVLLMMAHVI